MTENVYVIKIKTKPPLSSLYPSERRYSASTVGGMSLVHLILGFISLVLSTVAMSVPGHILSLACLVPFVTGFFAWRRWYIDRNISIFFYGSLFSSVIAIICSVVIIVDVTVLISAKQSLQSLKTLDAHSVEDFTNDTHNITSSKDNPEFSVTEDHDSPKINESSELLVTLEPHEFNVSDFHDGIRNGSDNNLKEEKTMILKEIFQVLHQKMDVLLWRKREFAILSDRILMTFNLLIASSFEMFWSMMSVQVAFHGMKTLPESGNVVAGSKTTKLPLQKRKPPAPKPDILNHDHRMSENLQNFATLQDLTDVGLPRSRLPLPESSRESRERVERFLANQATHRVVEDA